VSIANTANTVTTESVKRAKKKAARNLHKALSAWQELGGTVKICNVYVYGISANRVIIDVADLEVREGILESVEK
jgi:hypothetical protein